MFLTMPLFKFFCSMSFNFSSIKCCVLLQDVQVDSLFRHLQESDGTPASERETSNQLKVSFTINDFIPCSKT